MGVSDPSAEEQQAVSGFSKEERQELARLFKKASEALRINALTIMEEATGLDDTEDRAVYIAFLKSGE